MLSWCLPRVQLRKTARGSYNTTKYIALVGQARQVLFWLMPAVTGEEFVAVDEEKRDNLGGGCGRTWRDGGH